MFKPKYNITDRILNNISEIAAAREFVERAKLIPKWELKLRKEARVHNAHSSTSIEGNPLTLEQVRALADHKEVTAAEKDKREVVNYLKAIDEIPRYAGQKTIDIRLILRVHKAVTAGTLKNNKDSGAFRDYQVFVGRRVFDGTGLKEIVEYMPPAAADVPRLIDDFLKWFNGEEAKTPNPIILAGIVHYEIARIHPFVDGNGRTARLMAALVMYRSGFDHRRFFALDDYYDGERSAYYAALKTVQEKKGDITEWLEYFTGGVLYSISHVKESILKIGISPRTGDGSKIELTRKQMQILERIREKGSLSNKDLREMFDVSRQAIVKEMSKLVKTGIVVLVGKGRNAYYRISE